MSRKFPPDRIVSNEAGVGFDDLGFSTRTIHERSKLVQDGDALSSAAASSKEREGDEQSSTQALEKKLADLEGAEAGLVLASGLAGFRTLAISLMSNGDEMIVHRPACTETAVLMEKTLSGAGIKMVPVDLSDPANIHRWATDRTRLIYFETPTNPLNEILDIAAIAQTSRSLGLKVAVDNTFASPALQRPIEHGADIVVQSLTKYINGHGDTLGGALLADDATVQKMRETSLRSPSSTAISQHASFLILRGVKTLALRMDRHSSAAHAIALTLEAHPAVAWVRYPLLHSHPNYSTACRQMSGGSGLLAFGLHAGKDGAGKMISRLRLVTPAVSLAEVGSLICGSASLSGARHLPLHGHHFCSVLGEDVLRFSAGLEDPEDLVEDVLQALSFVGN